MTTPAFHTLVHLVRTRGETQTDRVAFHYLTEGDVDGPIESLTYGQLLQASLRIGARVQAAVAKGAHVLLLHPPGLEFVTAFFGCLFGGAIPVPAYPPDVSRLDRTLPRLRAIVRDSNARLILTTQMIAEMGQAMLPLAPELAALPWLATDEAGVGDPSAWVDPQVQPGDVAFLQYTSGSTSEPKGVMVTHANLLHNVGETYRLGEHHDGSAYVSWLPSYHDMGLIGGILQPLHGGFVGVLMSPMSFLTRPARWLQAITRYRATTSPFPNFALDLCVRKVPPAIRATLDLSSWKVACNGAEPIRAETLARFTEVFGPCGFRHETHYPAYGLAEGTLMASGGSCNEPPQQLSVVRAELQKNRVVLASEGAAGSQTLVGCGKTLLGQELVVVDPSTRARLPDLEVGEIWLRGPSVALGYWNRPELTEEIFGARLASGEGPYLRTGDLGFLRDGELYVTGRMKDLMIMRGRNYYPQDIELTVERSHPAIRPGCVVAFSLSLDDGEEQLAIAAEVDPRQQPEPEALRDVIRTAVSNDHLLRAQIITLLEPGGLPKTSSGKLQRAACRTGHLEGTLRAAF
ncbi:MAG: fatty acyl-AMP ligase [Myxococcota bacterium]